MLYSMKMLNMVAAVDAFKKRRQIINTDAKYLRITIHDNDFRTSLEAIGELLYESFQFEGNYPTEAQFSMLKECIKYLWFGANMTKDLMRWGEITDVDIDYFNPRLEFVDYLDIPDWDNGESIYIPMFDDAEIISR